MPPQAFLSYARIDDDAHPGGVITRLKIALEKEVRAQGGGKTFTIFQDKDGILAGEHWPSSLEEALQSVRVIIPVLSPGYFDSSPCAWELGKFQQLETTAGRNDLIIPLYFINTLSLENDEERNSNPIAAMIAERQRFDWRELRFEPFDSPVVTKELAKLAQAVVRALTRRDVTGLVQERDRLRQELVLLAKARDQINQELASRNNELSQLRADFTKLREDADESESKAMQQLTAARREVERLEKENIMLMNNMIGLKKRVAPFDKETNGKIDKNVHINKTEEKTGIDKKDVNDKRDCNVDAPPSGIFSGKSSQEAGAGSYSSEMIKSVAHGSGGELFPILIVIAIALVALLGKLFIG